SMGTGPTSHDRAPIQAPSPRFDLAVIELLDGEHRFLGEAGSDIGAELLRVCEGDTAAVEDQEQARALADGARAAMVRHVDNDGIKELLYAAADHPRLDEVVRRCLS